jgi:hypothetical protein
VKKILYLLVFAVLILSMTGCVIVAKPKEQPKEEAKAEQPKEEATAEAKPEPKKEEPVKVEEWVIVDHKTKDFGGNVPNWVTKTPLQLQKEDIYQDYYVFIEDQTGKDLEGVKLWATGFSINSAISRMVATRVQNRFAGAAVGDKDMVETYMEQVVKTVSEASFSNVRVEDEFWVKRQNKTGGEIEYRYLFLVTVPKTQIEAAIERAFGDADEQEKPKTEEEKVARERVKEAFEEEL